MKTKETWTDIPGYKGVYQLSNLDRVKSLKFSKEKILKGRINYQGYILYSLCKDGNCKTFGLHVIKMMTFKGFKPEGFKMVIDHIDNDPTNNCLSNLQAVTNRRNVSKKKKVGTSKYTGVSWSKKRKKWVSQIMINGKVKHLGRFTSEIEAHQVYQEELNRYKEESPKETE